jgi:CRISPR-associated protein Cmr2
VRVADQESLLVFSIGPVQGFIAAARKLEDLWSGSYILSQLAGVAIDKIFNEAQTEGLKVSLVYPAQRERAQYVKVNVASIPNRFIIRIYDEDSKAAQLAQAASEAVRNKFIEMGTYAIRRTFSKETETANMYELLYQQVDALLEIFWAVETMHGEKDYDRARQQVEKRLAAVKNCRPYVPYRQQGLVCTLCGEHQALTEKANDENADYGQMKRNLVHTWSKRKPEFQALRNSKNNEEKEGRIKDGEGLCAICLTKRLARQYFCDYVDRSSFGVFPSTHDIAGDSKYYAVLRMDGDDMGKWVSGEKAGLKEVSMAYQEQLSRNLESFAARLVPEQVEQYAGQLIYAGGDDVLVFVAVDKVLSLAKGLRLGFGKHLGQGWDTEIDRATASLGIVIAHEKTPLSTVLNYASRMEEQAKDYKHPTTYKAKDALGLAVLTHGGEIREVILPWALDGGHYDGEAGNCAIDSLQSFLDMVENDLSIHFVEQFAQAFLPLLGADYKKDHKVTVFTDNDSMNHKLIQVELQRVMRRSLQEDHKIDNLEVKTEALIQLYKIVPSTLQFIHLLQICRFLRKEIIRKRRENE